MTSDNPERDRWDARYAGDDYVFGTEPNAFLAAQAHRFRPGQRALAVADGEGRNGVWLARQGLDVATVELSPVAVEKARRLAARHGVTMTIECADLASWRWESGCFDLVVGIFIQFAGPTLRDLIFRRMKEALKPGGLLLLEGYRPEQLNYKTGGPSEIDNLYTTDLLRNAFADMKILHLAAYDAVISEGARHRGMSALVDLVAQLPPDR